MRQVRSLPGGDQADAGDSQPHLRGTGRGGRRRAADRAGRNHQGRVVVRPGPDRLEPRPLHDPPLRPGVRRAHPRQALPGGRVRGDGQCPLLERLPGQRGHPRLRLAGGREALRRGAAAAPRAEPLRGGLFPRLLPLLRGQVPAVDAGRPGLDPRHQAVHGRSGGDDPVAGGPRERAERPAEDRHRGGGAGGALLRLFPRPPGIPAEDLRGRAAAGRDAGAGHSRLPAAARDRRPRGPHDRAHGRGNPHQHGAGRGLHAQVAARRRLRRRVSGRRRADGRVPGDARRGRRGHHRRLGLPPHVQPPRLGAGGQATWW